MKLMKFNKAKNKLQHLVWGAPKHQYRMGDEWIESSPVEEDPRNDKRAGAYKILQRKAERAGFV